MSFLFFVVCWVCFIIVNYKIFYWCCCLFWFVRGNWLWIGYWSRMSCWYVCRKVVIWCKFLLIIMCCLLVMNVLCCYIVVYGLRVWWKWKCVFFFWVRDVISGYVSWLYWYIVVCSFLVGRLVNGRWEWSIGNIV